ncbi:MAG TPA: bifunctional phosphoribosyl-AMP cyclohydrolase/phosphoribosyl-ATP diphosphatase [Cytophagales bacterium]|jgi:phosphoribosyl-ATP pyrophosphohydrolase/phosphoribosyl-AMP cyclohydrolase|nr:bifunctional phosphoribosyl-AMP cyclohydrolase/phosphoribosyl-ATP diphosphatase [Cytophagales bacterium]
MKVDFDKNNDLVPAIIQDEHSQKVLMLGYMNQEALEKTQKEGRVTFYSRSKNRLWTKGETSGNYLNLVNIESDCDHDTLLVTVNPVGPVCHTGSDTCFDHKNQPNAFFLNYLQQVIKLRKNDGPGKSYTKSLFDKGINKIAQKVGEEAVELVIEAKESNDELFKNEAADLLFHLLVLLEEKGFDLNDIIEVLHARHK